MSLCNEFYRDLTDLQSGKHHISQILLFFGFFFCIIMIVDSINASLYLFELNSLQLVLDFIMFFFYLLPVSGSFCDFSGQVSDFFC